MSDSDSHLQIINTTMTIATKENISDDSRDQRESEETNSKSLSTHYSTEMKSQVKKIHFPK
jgi:hypothetical protein